MTVQNNSIKPCKTMAEMVNKIAKTTMKLVVYIIKNVFLQHNQ